MREALTIQYAPPSDSGAGYVALEQEPWPKFTGYLTQGGVIAYVKSLLFGDPTTGQDNEDDCGMWGGSFSTKMYACPYPHGLHYTAGLSHGSVGGRVIQQENYAEVVLLQQANTATLRYPTDRIISAEWLADAYDIYGRTTSRPRITTTGGRVTVDRVVYGAMLVVYEVVRHIYGLAIGRRENYAENLITSHFYAVWDGGNNSLACRPPPDGEDGAHCRHDDDLITGYTGGNMRPGAGDDNGDDDDLPTVRPKDENYSYDWCCGPNDETC
jgi:hypothetical protein